MNTTTLLTKHPTDSYVDAACNFRRGTLSLWPLALLLTSFGAALGPSSITLTGTDNLPPLELVLTAGWGW